MAFRKKTSAPKPSVKLPADAFIDLSLRNHLCLHALYAGHGNAFHLGIIVRAMFHSFFLFDAGYGGSSQSMFTSVDRILRDIALTHTPFSLCNLTTNENSAIAKLLVYYDNQMQTAPLDALINAHHRVQANFNAPPNERSPIPALLLNARGRETVEFQLG